VAHGKVEVYDRRNKPMPAGWAVNENGQPITDATAFEQLYYGNPKYGGHLYLGGAGEESGGHKGYGLGLLVEVLCAGLSMGVDSHHTFTPGRGSGIAHFFGAIRLGAFGDVDGLKNRIGAILDDVRNSETAEGHERVYIHGEKEHEARQHALNNGIELDTATSVMLDELITAAAYSNE
jgi:LDH2 family malate/lactate/ureidoglycolate dehydrogenase